MKLIVGILVVVIGLFVVVIWLATGAGNTLAKQAQKLEETAARGTDWLDVVAYKKPKQYFKTDSEHNMGRRRRTWNEQEIGIAKRRMISISTLQEATFKKYLPL